MVRCFKPEYNKQEYHLWFKLGKLKGHGMMDGRVLNECIAIFFRCKIIKIVKRITTILYPVVSNCHRRITNELPEWMACPCILIHGWLQKFMGSENPAMRTNAETHLQRGSGISSVTEWICGYLKMSGRRSKGSWKAASCAEVVRSNFYQPWIFKTFIGKMIS